MASVFIGEIIKTVIVESEGKSKGQVVAMYTTLHCLLNTLSSAKHTVNPLIVFDTPLISNKKLGNNRDRHCRAR